MRNKTDYTDRKFGLLTVMECIVSSDGTNKGGLWLCKCKCSKLISLSGYSLHHRKSCGCMVKKAAIARGITNRKPQMVTITAEYSRYNKLHEEPLSKLQWLAIVQSPCTYCNSIDIRNRVLEQSYKYTIPLTDKDKQMYQVQLNDIVDGKSCCNKCKQMKGKLSEQEFIEHIALILHTFSQ